MGAAPPADPAPPPLAVLLAEHEPEVAELARRYLQRAGAQVTVTTGPEETTAALGARRTAVAVLDLTMPGLDARRLRRLLAEPRPPGTTRAPTRRPAIFLLGSGMRPRDLRVSVESCLWRPFSPRLLVSRVLSAAPVSCTSPATDTHRVSSAGQDIALTPAEFALLSVLAEHAGRVLSRDRLLAALARPTSGRAIDVHITQLRAKLPEPCVIRTVRGVGYVLDATAAADTPRMPPGG